MAMRKRPSNKKTRNPRRQHQNTAGENASKKTRSPMPATRARKAATGKRVD